MSSKNNITGVRGEYFVAAELGKRDILALTTPKNNHFLIWLQLN